ncbi:MAG: MFS transporter [Pseudomonadota bacterium]
MSDTSPFAVPAYLYLFSAHTTALIGSGVSTIALALLAIEIAPDRASLVLAVALAIKMVAYVLVAPFAGQIGAFISAKRLLIALDLLRALVVASMPWISNEWQIYGAIALISSASALFTPNYQALLPSVVVNEQAYIKALSWAQVASSIEQIASPALAAALLLVFTFNDLFFLNGATFLLSALLIWIATIANTRAVTKSQSPWWGIQAYLKTPRLRAVGFAYMGIAGGSAMVIVNTAVYVQQFLGQTESAIALTLAASGLGTALGALIVPRLSVPPRVTLSGGNFLIAFAIMMGVTKPGWLQLTMMWFLVGLGLGLSQTPVGVVIRRSCHERHRAAFFAANFTLSHAWWLFAYLLAGLLANSYNWQTTFALMGFLPLVGGLACLFLYPQPDEALVTHQHGEVVHRHEFYIDESHTSWPR